MPRFHPLTPVSMLILMHSKKIPIVAGVINNIEIIEKLYFSKILNITLVIPTENNNENK